jgi:hypothetical protein
MKERVLTGFARSIVLEGCPSHRLSQCAVERTWVEKDGAQPLKRFYYVSEEPV